LTFAWNSTDVPLTKAARQSPEQKIHAYSFSLNTAAESAAALEAVSKAHDGKAPDAVFMCAGSSKPKFFVEMDEHDMSDGMVAGYWVQAWTALVRILFMIHATYSYNISHRLRPR
jgi:hypothetical protein